MPSFPAAVRKFLLGNPFGEVFPVRPNPPPLVFDGRTAALRLLRTYITNLTFYRRGNVNGPPVAFTLKTNQFQIEPPDSPTDMVLPSIAVLPGKAIYDNIGLTSYIEEETLNLYSQGTVLQWQSEYMETIQLEITTATKAERRAMMAGLEIAFSPTEQMAGLRFFMPEYFGEPVMFMLNGRQLREDEQSTKKRRVATMEFEMRFNVVALVNAVSLQPTIKVNTDLDQDTGQTVVIDPINDPFAQVGAELAPGLTTNQTGDTPDD